MKKSFLIIFLVLCLFLSCVSKDGGEHYTDEERRDALEILISDMIELSAARGDIEPESFSAMLPHSYTVYESYSPIYSMLEDGYTSKLSEIFSPLLSSCYSLVGEEAESAISGGDIESMVNDTEGMTDRLQELLAVSIYSYLLNGVQQHDAESREAFSESSGVFNAIHDSYVNLLSVGSDIEVPVPQPLSQDQIAFVIIDVLFTRLGESERELKSRIPDSPDSPYAVFWEGTL